MKTIRSLGLFLTSGICLTISFSASGEVLRRIGGEESRRSVLSEERPDGTLLLVMERASSKSVPKILFRKLFAESESSDFETKRDYFRSLPNRFSVNSAIEATFNRNPLWKVTHFWTLADEKDYSNWVTTTVKRDMLVGTGIAIDCADLAVLLRWVYSRDHGLPVANSLADTGELFGQWLSTAEWDLLPTDPDWKKDERFKAALRFVLDSTYTHSLRNDLYPALIVQDWVTVGSIYLHLRGASGHTQVLYKIAQNSEECQSQGGCLQAIWGNEPSAEGFYSSSLQIYGDDTEATGAFMRYRWPLKDSHGNWSLTPKSAMPGYSIEEYDWLDNFEDIVWDHLGYSNLTDVQKAVLEGQVVLGMLNDRVLPTQIGYYMCSIIKCDPKGALYDAYSSPSKDERLHAHQKNFLRRLSVVSPDAPEIARFKSQSHLPLMRRNDVWMDDFIFNKNGILDRLQSDPTKSLFERWGLTEANTETENKLATLFSAWSAVWDQRVMATFYGSSACGATWETDGKFCPVGSDLYSLYSTQRLDLAFKTITPSVAALVSSGSAELQGAIEIKLSRIPYGVQYGACSWNPDGACTAKDFFYNSHGVLRKMTFAPDDSVQKRYGLTP